MLPVSDSEIRTAPTKEEEKRRHQFVILRPPRRRRRRLITLIYQVGRERSRTRRHPRRRKEGDHATSTVVLAVDQFCDRPLCFFATPSLPALPSSSFLPSFAIQTASLHLRAFQGLQFTPTPHSADRPSQEARNSTQREGREVAPYRLLNTDD